MSDPSLLPPPLTEPSTTNDPHSQATEIARLQALVQQHQELLDALPMMIFVYEVISRTAFRLISQNRAARLSGGFDAAVDLTGTLLSDILSPEDTARATRWFQQCLDANAPVEAEEPYIFPSGTIWTHTTYIPMHDSAGHIAQILLLVRDITAAKEREQLEQQRQAEIIAQQTATLAELSTPLLTISDTTVVMPLVGAIDSQRIQQIMDNLLSGIADSHAQAVILDITGVPIVDTQVASALLRASQAVSLLGSQVILTGIRPEVAQTLVGLGTDLRGIITRGTLQDGIAYALRG
jgi:PAS domain S-box-containing protein